MTTTVYIGTKGNKDVKVTVFSPVTDTEDGAIDLNIHEETILTPGSIREFTLYDNRRVEVEETGEFKA